MWHWHGPSAVTAMLLGYFFTLCKCVCGHFIFPWLVSGLLSKRSCCSLLPETHSLRAKVAFYSVIIYCRLCLLSGAIMAKHGGQKKLELIHWPTKETLYHLALLCLRPHLKCIKVELYCRAACMCRINFATLSPYAPIGHITFNESLSIVCALVCNTLQHVHSLKSGRNTLCFSLF